MRESLESDRAYNPRIIIYNTRSGFKKISYRVREPKSDQID